MTIPADQLLSRYQPYRRVVEPGFWILNYVLNALFNSLTVAMDAQREHLVLRPWEPAIWEWSSNLVLLALVPAVVAFERRFPLHFDTLRRNLPIHVLASLVYSVAHVLAMVGLRKVAYATQGGHYDFGHWPRELVYEYLKDWRSYVSVVTTITVYRFMLRRAQGEARLLDPPDDGPALEPIERPDRFLVRKLGKEFLVAANDIEVLQAAGNYVNLRVRGRDYPLRATMAGIEPRLDPARFVRVHRSYMVNLDCLAEIEPLETGDARLLMRDGTRVPCSRRYRAALRRGAASSAPA